MKLALGISLPTSNKGGLTLILKQVNDFRDRVIADSGIFEAKTCLVNQLKNLNNIAWVY